MNEIPLQPTTEKLGASPAKSIWQSVAAIVAIFVTVVGLTVFFIHRYVNDYAREKIASFSTFMGIGAGIQEDNLRLTGRVYLSLVPLATSSTSSWQASSRQATTMGIYEFELATRKLYKTLTDNNFNMTPSYTAEHPQVLFSSRNESEKNAEFQIELYDERVKLPPFRVTDSLSSEKRFPTWAPDRKQFAFTAHDSNKIAVTPNDWDVYVYRFNTNSERGFFSSEVVAAPERRIAKGFGPVFSPTGLDVLYLKNDGIYASPVDGGTEFQLAEAEQTDLSSRFSISDDGKLLVWTRPKEKTVEIYAVSTTPIALVLKSRLNIMLREPHFAGLNDEYIVGIADSKFLQGAQALFSVDIRTGDQKELLVLRAFDPSSIFLSDVRQ